MVKQATPPAQMQLMRPDPRLRVGVIAGDPLRMLGFQTIFDGHIVIAIVPVAEDDSLDKLDVDVVLVAAQNTSQVFEAISDIRAVHPEMPLLVMSAQQEPEFIERVLRVGAHGYVMANAERPEIEEAIAHVYDRKSWTPLHAGKQTMPADATVQLPVSPEPNAFTERELQVLDLLHSGQSNREIAVSLRIEERTVKSHVARLLKKMGVKNRTALIMQAITRNLVGSPDPR